MYPWDTDDALFAYNIKKVYNSKRIKVMLPKFLLDLIFFLMSFVYKFNNICLMQT